MPWSAHAARATWRLALNTIWGARAPQHGLVLSFRRDRFLSFAMVLIIGFLLLVSLALSSALSALGAYAAGLMPRSAGLLEGAHFLVSSAIITLLFALIFKYIPDTRIRWRPRCCCSWEPSSRTSSPRAANRPDM